MIRTVFLAAFLILSQLAAGRALPEEILARDYNFTKYDENGDDLISEMEYDEALGGNQALANLSFAAYDVDSNGYWSEDEFNAFVLDARERNIELEPPG